MPCLEEAENDARKRARLVDSLSRSFPSSALSKVLLSNNCDENTDPLSSSCFANIRLEKFGGPFDDDEELTSLAWLQDANLLKNITPAGKCVSPPPKHEPISIADLSNPAGLAYDPLLNSKRKPPVSFSCLIAMAIEASPSKRLPVKGIYDWIVKTFPFFRTAPTGWRNSVRHNLSLNKCFKKVERDHRQGLGKGSSWCIDPVHRSSLLQALKRIPYHPFQQLQMTCSSNASEVNLETEDVEVDTFSESVSLPEVDKKSSSMANQRVNNHGANPNSNQRFLPRSSVSDSRSTLEKIIQNLRSRVDANSLVCTPYPTEDHTYSVSESVFEEARAEIGGDESVDEGLDSISHTDVEDEDSSPVESSDSVDNKKSVEDEEKTLYFTSLALLELAAGNRIISDANKAKTSLPLPQAEPTKVEKPRKNVKKLTKRQVKSSQKRNDKACKKRLDATKEDVRKEEAPVLKSTRKRKNILPINSSLWGKRRRLSETDVAVESSPKKSDSTKSIQPVIAKRTVTRRRKSSAVKRR